MVEHAAVGQPTTFEGDWHELVAALAVRWATAPLGPFETELVLVSSAGVGRVLGQQLAGALGAVGEGICAGVDFATIPQIRRRLTATVGLVDSAADPWRTRALTFAVATELQSLVDRPNFAMVSHHLGTRHDPNRPGRWLSASNRFARLLLRYSREHPAMLRAWTSGHATDATGGELAPEFVWQFELWRALVARTDVPDPTTRANALAAHAGSHARVQTFALGQLDALDSEFLQELRAARPVEDYVLGGHAPTGARPTLTVHGSHGPARQVGVLRDVLAGLLQDDPDLEPRDIVVFCPDLSRYAPLVQAAFHPTTMPGAHPGHGLRVALAATHTSRNNDVLGVLSRLLTLPQGRALASDLVDLCAMAPVAHRFRLDAQDVARISELLAAANVRWGIDPQHRQKQFGLGVPQNTWLAGLDQLLAGIAMPGDDMHWLGTVLPSDAPGSSDAAVVGALAEIVSRIRWFVHRSAEPMPMQAWVALLREAVALFADTPADDAWMMHQAHDELATLDQQLDDSAMLVSRSELGQVFERLVSGAGGRPNYGNGALLVTTPGELAHVPHKVVCLLGLDARRHRDDHGDAIDLLAPTAPDLVWQAASAATQQVTVVYAAHDDATGQPVPEPAPLAVLRHQARAAGWPVAAPVQHALNTHGAGEFSPDRPFSFDKRAANALLAPRAGTHRAPVTVDPPLEVTVDDLVTFLDNPANYHLKYRIGPMPTETREVARGLPLDPQGLDRWAIGDRMLRLAEAGAAPVSIAQAEWRRGTVGPRRIGERTINATIGTATAIADASAALRALPTRRIEVDATAAGVRLTGRLAARGDTLLVTTFSRTDEKPWVTAWVHLLAAAASGADVATAHVFGSPDWSGGPPLRLTQRVLRSPGRAHAAAHLSTMLALLTSGVNHVEPLPLKLGLRFAQTALRYRRPLTRDEIADKLDRDWKFGAKGSWTRFYPSVTDLLEAPASGGAESCRFAELALALYGPMVAATEVINHE